MLNIKQQAGATLLEILVTVSIISVSLLSMALLQSHSLKLNQSSLNRSQANLLAYQMIEKIRINSGSDGSNLDSYQMDYTESESESESESDEDDPVEADSGESPQLEMVAWKTQLSALLPEGDGKIQCSSETSTCSVSVRWSEAYVFGEGDDSDNGSQNTSEFSYQSRL